MIKSIVEYVNRPDLNKGLKLLLFICLLIVSLYGRSIPIDKDMYAEINRFTVRPYKYGLYVTELPSGIFYNFSAYDAYYTDPEGVEHRLMSQNPQIQSKESYLRYSSQAFIAKAYSVLSYFDITRPTASFDTSSGEIILRAIPEGNKVHFRLEKIPEGLIQSDKLTLTLSFNEDDIIFDQEGNLYTDNENETIQEFTEISGFELKKLENLPQKIGVKYKQALFVANKNTNGIIKIKLDNPNYNDSFVNLEKGLFEFDLVSKDSPEIVVELYESFEEAKQ